VRKGLQRGGKPIGDFFIMEGDLFIFQDISSHDVWNAVMLIGKFLSFARFIRRFPVPVFREKIFPAGFL
jgi:hypothetical protein